MSADRRGNITWLNSASIRTYCASALRTTRILSVSRSRVTQQRQRLPPGPDVRRGTIIALTIGVAAVAAAVIRAGAGAVAQALESLHLSGLLVLALLHLPIVVLMGFAWRLASGDDP